MKKEELEQILDKISEGVPQGRVQLGGNVRNSTATYTKFNNNGNTNQAGINAYCEGTSIPAGSSSLKAIFDSKGKPVRKLDDADLSQGAVIHKELAQFGESYSHNLYYVSNEAKISKIITMNDKSGSVVRPIGDSSSYVQQWYYFAYKSNKESILRRHNQNSKIGDFVIIPFDLVYDGGFPNPSVPMQDGLIYYNTKTGDTLKIEKTDKVADRNFLYKSSKINIKKDTLDLNGDRILEVGGNIDIVKPDTDNLYVVKSEIIDFFYLQNGGVEVFQRANPTDLEDRLLNREYNETDYQAGPQMRHTVYKMDIKSGDLQEIGNLVDSSHKGYEYTFQPADLGIKAISRDTKREINF